MYNLKQILSVPLLLIPILLFSAPCEAEDTHWPLFLPAITLVTNATEPVDCLGVVGGTAAVDECGVCNGDGSTCVEEGFTRSNSGNIVTDSKTNLMWQDTRPSFQTEAGGIAYCESQSIDGYTDWRLPTFDEIQSFFQRVDTDPDFDLLHWGTFSGCTASVAIGGYVKTPVGAQSYGGKTGDRINFSGGAAARCVR